MKNNIFSIMKKELMRLFGDKRLVFSGIILQGLLLYVMYTVMGSVMGNITNVDSDYKYRASAVNMPQSISSAISGAGMPFDIRDINESDAEAAKQRVSDNELDLLIIFSSDFDSAVAAFDIASGKAAPQVQIWHNAAHIESLEADTVIKNFLKEYERSLARKFDVNAVLSSDEYDLNTGMDFASSLMMSMIPMMLILVIYQGCMAIAPESISGEKERGTLGTLLATPARRSHIALAKILSITVFGVLGAIFTFAALMMSLPNLMADAESFSFNYSANDYLMVFMVTVSTVLVFVALLSILSAYAKSIKEATSYATPFMIVSIFCGMSGMFTGGALDAMHYYLIPIFNSAQSLTAIFNNNVSVTNIAITSLVNTAFAMICAVVLSRMFNSEKIVFDK